MSRRKDVPDICGAICALSEKLETLWQRTYDAVKTVNNVQPDGNNNLTVQAGTGIVINPINNGLEIECNIDPQGIETVNGVAADANENVDLVAGTGIAITPDPYNNEVEIACNIDVSGKVDKITTGSTWKAYTHNGATQGDMEISTVDVANSIPRRQADGTLIATTPASTDNGTRVATTKWVNDAIAAADAAAGDVNPTADTLLRRDGSGKAYGADPASGATDKTLVTANWISQTGSGRPNNVIHDSGNETIAGIKTFSTNILGNASIKVCEHSSSMDITQYWRNIIKIKRSSVSGYFRNSIVYLETQRSGIDRLRMIMLVIHQGSLTGMNVFKMDSESAATYKASYDSDYIYIWRRGYNSSISANSEIVNQIANVQNTSQPEYTNVSSDVSAVIGTDYNMDLTI